jgi:hypothetical protein
MNSEALDVVCKAGETLLRQFKILDNLMCRCCELRFFFSFSNVTSGYAISKVTVRSYLDVSV